MRTASQIGLFLGAIVLVVLIGWGGWIVIRDVRTGQELPPWKVVLGASLLVFVAGGVGGLVNALMTDNGFALPKEVVVNDVSVVRPGFLGNILVGATAAYVSWGLYGAFSNVDLFAT